MSLASWIRKQAADEGGSFNDAVVTTLEDLRSWYSAAKPIAQVVEDDREAFGDSRRKYLQRLLAYRYDELAKNPQSLGQQAG